jgi:hypothetical protein
MFAATGVPGRPAAALAVGVPVVEAATAALLLAPGRVAATAGAGLACALFAALSAGVAVAVRRGSTAHCQCFGGRGQRLSGDHVARNLTLTALAALAAVATASTGVPVIGLPAAVALVIAGLVAAAVVRWDDLALLARPVGAAGRNR